jgi:hypothetical protein
MKIGAPDPFNPVGANDGQQDPWGGRGKAPAAYPRKSSSYGRPYPVVYGTCAVKGVPLWDYDMGDLKFLLDGATGPVTEGRAAEVQYAFSYGPIQGFSSLIYGKRLFGAGGVGTSYIGATNPPSGTSAPDFFVGDGTTTAWAHYTGGWETRIPWPMLALMRCRYMWVPDGAGTIPEMKGIVAGRFATNVNTKRNATITAWSRSDALPGDVIRDLVENATYGLGMATGTVITATGADGTAASSYDRYCTANGWYIALPVEDDVSVEEVIAQVLQATNSVGVWTGGKFKVIPLGDSATGSGGTAYTPYLTAYAVTDDDIVIGSGDPIRSRRRSWSDTYNVIPVEYSCDTKNRDSELAVSEDLNVAHAQSFGVRRGEMVSLPCIRSAVHAQSISGILARISCYNRTTFEFTLSPRHGAILECGDLVSITSTVIGLSAQLARISNIDEDEEGNYRVSAVEWVTGATVTVEGTAQPANGYEIDPVISQDNYGALQAIASDSVFSAAEHASALTAWKDLSNSSAEVVAKATAVGVSSTPWTTALQTLSTYLNAGTTYTTGTPSWLTAPYTDIAITAATWRTNWDAAYSERNKILANSSSALNGSIAPASLSTTGTSGATATITSGQVTVVASGGTSPYSYTWSLVSGTSMTVTGQNVASFSKSLTNNSSASAVYRCTIADNKAVTATVDVSVYLGNYGSAPPLAATRSPTGVTGAGNGMASQDVDSSYTTVSPTGGTAPYSYSWAWVSGDTLTPTGTSYAYFTGYVAVDATMSSVYRCTVTDSAAATVTVDVTVNLSNWAP